jgi:dipeptide transport system permease protein
MTRSSMLEVLGEDYMRTARAKGLGRARIIFVHGLRNALVPVITVVGLMAGTIVTGAVLTETIFSWPGIGRWIVDSVLARDYPVVQSGILMIALIVILVNFFVDIAYAWANPRLRGRK